MPHLQFDINKKLNPSVRSKFYKKIIETFSQIMETGKDHIAISLREHSLKSLRLGRASSSDYVCIMNLDIREGRSLKQKRNLAIRYMEIVNELLEIKYQNQYLTYTGHNGLDFNLYEKQLKNWVKNDKPL